MNQAAAQITPLGLVPKEAHRPKKTVAVATITVYQLMTVAQLAALLQVTEGSIHGWVHKRKVPFRKLGRSIDSRGRLRNSGLRFDYNEIMQWTQTGEFPEWFVQGNNG